MATYSDLDIKTEIFLKIFTCEKCLLKIINLVHVNINNFMKNKYTFENIQKCLIGRSSHCFTFLHFANLFTVWLKQKTVVGFSCLLLHSVLQSVVCIVA